MSRWNSLKHLINSNDIFPSTMKMKDINKGIKKEMEKYEPIKQITNQTDKLIRRFPSGAVRSDDTGRIKPSMISPLALKAIASHFSANEADFGEVNYFKGIKPSDCKDSIGRHYLDLQEALMFKDESLIYEELKALAANCIMEIHQIELEKRGLYKEIFDKTELIKIK